MSDHLQVEIDELADQVIRACISRKWTIATAESCTGGLIAGALTSVAGSSSVFDRGFVTYSNEAKMEMIGVPLALLETDGAVVERTALAMAEGAKRTASVDLAVSVTGIAGPGGGSAEKPVGLVHMGIAKPDGTIKHQRLEFGDIGRTQIRLSTVKAALQALLELSAAP